MLIGLFHQPVEHRIVENGPPIGVVGEFGSDALVVLVDPTVGNRSGWLTVLGPNFEPIVNVALTGADVVLA